MYDAVYERKRRITRRRRQQTWLLKYKTTLACVRCGYDDFRALDFHHRDPSKKKYVVSNMAVRGYAKSTIMIEIHKCDVLCANCHRIEHDPRTSPTERGT